MWHRKCLKKPGAKVTIFCLKRRIFCMFIRVYDVTYVEIQFNRSKLRSFISSWKMVKNTIKFYRSFFSIKRKIKPELKCFVIRRYDLLTLNPKVCNFITSWNLIKMPQNFIQDSFSVKLTKICHKNRGEFLASVPLN